MQTLNFNEKLQKIKSLIKLWKRRYLTPLGKITVIKTLLLPILNHLFISIPNPNDRILNELNTMFYDFLWEGPAKIKQTVVVKQYCQGGLRMVNLKAFIKSMKVTWLRRLILTNSPWQSIIKDCINFNEFFSCGTSYLQSVLHKIKNKFWTDVLTAYIDLTDKNTVDNEDALLSSPIFYNKEIKVGNTPVWKTNWYKKGITHINGLIAENGEFCY